MWWPGRGNSGGSWLPEEKKANMWPGRGNSGGSWPPAFPRSSCPGTRYIWSKKFGHLNVNWLTTFESFSEKNNFFMQFSKFREVLSSASAYLQMSTISFWGWFRQYFSLKFIQLFLLCLSLACFRANLKQILQDRWMPTLLTTKPLIYSTTSQSYLSKSMFISSRIISLT